MRSVHNRLDLFWPWVILFASALTVFAVWTGRLPTLRPMLVFAFLLICPGMAYTRLLPVADPMIKTVLAVALSLAIDTAVAMVLLYAGAWAPLRGLIIIVAISLIGAALQIKIAGQDEQTGTPDL